MFKRVENQALAEDKEDNRVTYYSDLLDADKYVQQFLNVEDLNFDSIENHEESEMEMMICEPNKSDHSVFKTEGEKKKQIKKYSCFQNFQKHLVITIRSLVDCSRFSKYPETGECVKKLWKMFFDCKKINKTLVSLVVGDVSFECSKKVSEYQFNEMLEEFSLAEIKEAQKNIRAEIILQLREAKLGEELLKRRLKHKSEFCVYFNAFLTSLESGDLEKRMLKCTKLLKNQFL